MLDEYRACIPLARPWPRFGEVLAHVVRRYSRKCPIVACRAKSMCATYGSTASCTNRALRRAHLGKYYDWQVRGAVLNLDNTLDVSPEDVAFENFEARG